MSFIKFRDAVNKNLSILTKADQLFKVRLEHKDEFWDKYLASYPEGTNPIYKERTEHDCNCCKSFIRNIGNVVAVTKDGRLASVWDNINTGIEYYDLVAKELAELVRTKQIETVYINETSKVGNKENFGEDGIKHSHFYFELPSKFVMRKDNIPSYVGKLTTNSRVLLRSVDEISDSAIEIVEDLIAQNSLYRGAEFKTTVQNLKKARKDFINAKSKNHRIALSLDKAKELGDACKFKNTVIGTLLVDISEGVELEVAVKKYEDKVAPQNYKRTTALVTPAMVKKAEEKVKQLGLEDSLYRRFATEQDVNINNVLFVDRKTTKELTKVSAFDEISTKSTKRNFDKVQEMSIDKFIENVLPKAETLELYVENKHASNMFSLIAPVYGDSKNMFKWNNPFSWSYAGEVTDAIKERVKNAGGSVDGIMRASLSWSNYDDLDLHMIEPNGNEIYFSDKRSYYTGGFLDVDENAGSGKTRTPVENIIYKDESKLLEGDYKVVVHNFSKRESVDVGFTIQLELAGDLYEFTYDKAVRNNEKLEVATITYSKSKGFSVKGSVNSISNSKEVWGINTQNFVKVNMVMNSPNHWDNQTVGNKHLFFVLDNCKNPDDARGFYNEFLTQKLTEHRKVLEILSSKMKAKHSDNQLSGVGFSSTIQNEIIVKVSGSFNRIVKVKF